MLDDIIHIFYPREYTLSNGKVVKEKFNPTPYIVIAVIAVTIFFMNYCGVDFGKFFSRFHYFTDFIIGMFPPRWSFWDEIKKPMLDTITMSLLGTVFGCIVALPVSFYMSNNFRFSKVYLTITRGLLSIFRTLPTVIYASMLSIVIGTGTIAGTIALAIFSFTIAVKMMYEQIETIDMGPYEAVESTGASRLKCIITSAYPQVKGYYWSTVLYIFETNVRSAAILGYVGAGGIGVQINTQLSYRAYDKAGLILLVLVITVVIIETVSRTIRRKLVEG